MRLHHLLLVLCIPLVVAGWGEPDPRPTEAEVEARQILEAADVGDRPDAGAIPTAPGVLREWDPKWLVRTEPDLATFRRAPDGGWVLTVHDPSLVTVLGPDGGVWRGGGR